MLFPKFKCVFFRKLVLFSPQVYCITLILGLFLHSTTFKLVVLYMLNISLIGLNWFLFINWAFLVYHLKKIGFFLSSFFACLHIKTGFLKKNFIWRLAICLNYNYGLLNFTPLIFNMWYYVITYFMRWFCRLSKQSLCILGSISVIFSWILVHSISVFCF